MTKPCRAFDSFVVDGQSYVWIGDHAHVRKDERITIMATWQSTCRACGQPYQFTRPDRPAPQHPPRRCSPCVIADPPKGLIKPTTKNPGRPPLYSGVGAIEAEREHVASVPPATPRPPSPAPAQQATASFNVPPRRTGGMNGANVFTDR